MKSKIQLITTMLLVFFMQYAIAQERTISGVVSDNAGLPLPGVSVLVKGTRSGTQTDFDGKYSIKAASNQVLIFSYVGMKTQETKASSTNLNVKMVGDAELLSEVIVVGQGQTRAKKTIAVATSELKADALENKPQTDVIRSMQGKVAGVQITNTGGMAGSTSNIVIRANKSFTGSTQPLFVIDGVPFNTDSSEITSSFNQGASTASSRFGDIDPNNIENMTILKGLAASVTYGSQGRNGVILITTKGGKKSKKMNVGYSSTLFISEVANLPEFQNTYGGGNLNNNVQGNIGNWGGPFDGSILPHIYDQPHITSVFPQYAGATNPWVAAKNNVKDFFRKGVSNVHNFNLSGGEEKITYAFNAGYSTEDGMVQGNAIDKYNFGGSFTVQATEKLKFETSLTYFNTAYTSPPIGASQGLGVSSIFERLLYIPRNLDLMNLPFENPQTGENIFYRTDVDNPRWLLKNSGNKQDVNRFFGKFGFNYALSNKIGVKYMFGLDKYTDEQQFHQNKGGQETNTSVGYLRNTVGVSTLMNQDLIFSLKPITLVEDFQLSGIVGFNSRRDTYKQTGIASLGQQQFGILDHSYFQTQSGGFDPILEVDLNRPTAWTNILGVYMSADFSYKDYLYLTLAGRNDYVSVVEAQNQSIFYPSAALSFVPTDAFESLRGETLNFLKLRLAYGTSAGFPDRYLTRSRAIFNSSSFVTNSGSTPGTDISNILGNPDLKPELHREYEFGVDLEMFNRRVELNTSAYYLQSKDQIVTRNLDPSTGYTSSTINAGQIDNKGIEANLSIILLKTSNFSWTTTGIFSKNISKVVSLPEGQDKIRIEGFSNGIGNYAVTGQPYNTIMGSYALKDAQGRFIIDPTDGTIITSVEAGLSDKIIGDPNPDFRFNIDNTIEYKGFRFNALIEYVKGGDFYSTTASNLLRRGVTVDTEDNRLGTSVIPGVYGNPSTGEVILDSNGQPIANTIQMPGNQIYFLNLVDADSNNIYDATRVRLREVSLGYTLPSKFLKNTNISNISCAITAQNMWLQTFNIPRGTNVDPDLISTGDTNGLGLDFQTAPQSKRYGFSVKVNF